MSHSGRRHDPKVLGSGPQGSAGSGWRDPTALGDYYREPDNVMRGMSLSQASLDVPGRSPFKGLGGDFFCEPDNVLKGMQIAAEARSSLLHRGPLELQECLKMPDRSRRPDEGKVPDLGMTPERLGKARSLSSTERFLEGDVPPSTPSDPYFKFEATTVHMSSSQPWDIGNNLLDFLISKLVASITKVSRAKFAIKADLFVECSMCTVKVRTYKEGLDRYAVEFQRRSGDCVTFNKAFQQATKFLVPRFTPVRSVPEASRDFDSAFARFLRTENEGDVTPLLDMAGLVDLPALQAECAAALEDMAQDPRAAAALCSDRAFEEFKKLLQNNQTEVAYPTARMLLFLAQCPEAVPRFTDQTLLSMMLDKVQSAATSALVQQQLAQVLCAAITRCAAKLSRQVADHVMSELVRAIKGLGDGLTARNLKEAQLVLQFQRARASGWA
mmetsp:Transcript_35818/g.83317  ORF Transcript_35818/g.83317 Transcript_35818/m.83317 type:complete len:442 (+) Transcript_35818:93-1418(+)